MGYDPSRMWRLLLLGAALVGAASAAEHPNVLFIAIDDLNDWVGVLDGHPNAKTPNIDRLASRGTLFTNAHTQAPICGPSRASLLSGLYPHTTGMYQQPKGGNRVLREDKKFFDGHLLPQYMASHGYKTMATGKITHGYPQDVAFEQSMKVPGGSGPKPKQRFAHHLPDVPYTGTQTDWGAYPERDEQMPDHKIANWAIDRLAESHDKPFLLAVGFHRPHVPWYVPKKWFDQHPLERVELPAIDNDDFADIPEIGWQVHEMPKYPQLGWMQENGEIAKAAQAYLASTTFVDHQVGRVLEALASGPYAENTVIVLFSDHGYHLGEKHRWSKHGLWEESTRVPLIVVQPGGGKAQRSTRPVGLIDLYPTILEMAGLPARPANEGRSLTPLLAAPDAPWGHPALTNYARGNYSVRGQRYRYIRYGNGAEELYDHETDPNEWRNLAEEKSHAATLHRLRAHVPKQEAPYHPGTSERPVNAWFAKHLATEGVKAE